MKKYLLYIIVTVSVIILAAGGYLYYRFKHKTPASTQTSSSNNQTASNSTSQNPVSNPANTPAAIPAPTLVYPINNFASRMTKNLFSSFYTSQNPELLDRQVCAKSVTYTGYHTGLDLEATSTEQNAAVPVVSIAAGTVQQASYVGGYGGLIVIEYTLGGQTYTAYFGHINLSTITVKAGDSVTVGEKLAELAPTCSQANDYVRKHLHFALHKGSAIDVKGYVPDKTTLSNWTDPATLLANLGAV